MSVGVTAKVWAAFPEGGPRLLAMLALADYANDGGHHVYPAMRTLAAKLRCSRSQARRLVRELVNAGYVQLVGNGNGGAHGATNRYRIALERLTGSAHATGSTDATGSADAQDGSHPCDATGSTDATPRVASMRPNPSMNHQRTVKGTTKARTRARDRFDPLTVELPDGVPADAWRQFVDHRREIKHPLTEQGAARMLERLAELHKQGHDITAAIDNSIRNGWRDVFPPKAAGAIGHAATQPDDPAVAMRQRHGGYTLWAIEHLMRAGFSQSGAEALVLETKAAVDKLADPRRTPEALLRALLQRDPRTERPGAWLVQQVREHADPTFRLPERSAA